MDIVPISEHVIEVGDGVRSAERVKVCAGAICGFADATASLQDAQDRSASIGKLLTAVVLCIVFVSVEVFGGIKASSLAIMTDAAHLLLDVAAFAISLFSIWASGWAANPRQSYGFFRIEILGALVSIQMIWLLAGILVYEAIVRLLYDTGDVQGFLMFIVSAFGLLVNIIMAVLLGHNHGHSHDHGHNHSHSHSHDYGHNHSHHDDNESPLLLDSTKQRNINVQGAYLHVLGDSIQSTGVMIGGAIIWYRPEWKIVNLICTLIFSMIVLGTTIGMLRNILEVLMESTPREIDPSRLEKGLCEMEGFVRDGTIMVTVGKILLCCHVRIKADVDADMVLDRVI